MEVVSAESQGRGLRTGLHLVLGQLPQPPAVALVNSSVAQVPVCVSSYPSEPLLVLSKIRRPAGGGCLRARYRLCTGNDRSDGLHCSKQCVRHLQSMVNRWVLLAADIP